MKYRILTKEEAQGFETSIKATLNKFTKDDIRNLETMFIGFLITDRADNIRDRNSVVVLYFHVIAPLLKGEASIKDASFVLDTEIQPILKTLLATWWKSEIYGDLTEEERLAYFQVSANLNVLIDLLSDHYQAHYKEYDKSKINSIQG